MENARFDIYQAVTDRIIAKLEKGRIPWNMPWASTGSTAVSHETGKQYSLLNQLILEPGEYITFNQCKKENGSVKKGAKGSMVVYWDFIKREEKNSDGTTAKDKEGNVIVTRIPFLKYYTVFNVNDCTGITTKHFKPSEPVKTGLKPDSLAEKIVKDYASFTGVKINRENSSDSAFYRPSDDSITVPCLGQYASVAEYYSTLFHEITHSTGHSSRLNRLTKTAFASKEYSAEELVAEIGACSLVNYCGLEIESSFTNSVAYIQGWLSKLKNDKKLIVLASGKAEKAYNYIINCLKPETPETPDKPKKTRKSAEQKQSENDKALVKELNATLKEIRKENKFKSLENGIIKDGNFYATNKFIAYKVNYIPDGIQEVLYAENKEKYDYVPETLVKFFNDTYKDNYSEIKTPDIAEVKKFIKDNNITIKNIVPYELGENLPAVNPLYLKRILSAMPNCTVYVNDRKLMPVMFVSETVTAILCITRKK